MFATLAAIALQVVTVAKPLPPGRPPVSPRAAVAPAKPATPAPPTSDSVRPPSEVRIASQQYAASVRGCYEREGLRQDPGLAAEFDITVTIDPQGAVRQVKVDTADVHGLAMANVMTCVQTAAMQWHFSSGAYAVEELTFSYKLVPPTPASRDTTPHS